MKVYRVMLSVLGITAMAAVGVPLGASAAPDALTAQCTLSAPTRVAIGRPTVNLPIRISGPCTEPNGAAGWDVDWPDTRSQNINFAQGASTGVWTFNNWMPVGLYVWKPTFAQNSAGTSLTQNSVTATAKLAAGAWISSKRVGDVVTLNGTSLLYSTTNNNYFKRSAGGVFQFRERGTTTWKNLKSVTTNGSGVVSMSYRYSKTRDYRFALYSTAISWDLGSAVTTR